MRRSRMLAAAAAAALALAGAACSSTPNVPAQVVGTVGSADAAAASQSVTIQYSSFIPSRVTISAGQTVVWNWEDNPIPHDVSFYGMAPLGSGGSVPAQPTTGINVISPILVTGSWAHKFTQPGVYFYRCSVHAQMMGEVIVTP